MSSDVALSTFLAMVEHIRQHHDRLERLADDVLATVKRHDASVRDVVAVIGMLLAKIEHQDYAVEDVLAALQLAHEKRGQARLDAGH